MAFLIVQLLLQLSLSTLPRTPFFLFVVLEFYKECQIFDKNTTLTLIDVK